MFISGILITSVAASQSSPKPEDDAEEIISFGRQTFVDNCLICHGEEMSSAQRLTAKQWTTEVEKMVGWGAPVLPEKKSALLAYLTTSFSDHSAASKLDTATATELIRSAPAPIARGDVGRGGLLYTQHCATCHGATGQGSDLGPILVERLILLHDASYHDAVRKGVRRMPGFSLVLKPEGEDDLLAWLRSRRIP